MGFSQSCFEGDSEIVINALQGNNMFMSSFDHLIKDTPLCKLLQSYSFSHSIRQGNVVTHVLVQRVNLVIFSVFSLNKVCAAKYK